MVPHTPMLAPVLQQINTWSPIPFQRLTFGFMHAMKCPQKLPCRPPAQGPSPTASIQTFMFQLLTPWRHGPLTHSLTVASSTEMYTLSPQTESFAQDRVRKECNRKTGQTMIIRNRARPDKSINQQPIQTSPSSFIFPLSFLPKSLELPPFPVFGFPHAHPIISHE